MKEQYLFGEEHFEKWGKCKTYPIPVIRGCSSDLYSLVDHSFIADCACIWGGNKLEGHELAVVSRTYCNDDVINNPPDGLMCIRLSKKVMGKDDLGTAIATVIIGNTDDANSLLNLGIWSLPAQILPYMLPIGMLVDYKIGLEVEIGTNFPKAKIINRSY